MGLVTEAPLLQFFTHLEFPLVHQAAFWTCFVSHIKNPDLDTGFGLAANVQVLTIDPFCSKSSVHFWMSQTSGTRVGHSRFVFSSLLTFQVHHLREKKDI